MIVPLIAVVIYFLTASYRKRAYYHDDEKRWKKQSPTDLDFIKYSLFLIGDAGAPSLKSPDLNLDLLRSQLVKTTNRSGIIFLGDNIYPKGMPRPGDEEHARAEKRILRQLEVVDGYKGNIWFISGNHDWNKGRKGGYESVMRQQFYIESFFGRRDVYLPRNGCPGPVTVDVNGDLAIIFINTQWWVHSGTRPIGKAFGCSVDSEHDFFLQLEEALQRQKGKRVVVIGHHPVYSASHHGGHFSLKQHFFPLTSVHKKLYVPMPLAGSVYPMYRKYFGSKEDMSHPKYKNLRKRLIDIFSNYDNLIYVSGHDHNLQYIKKKNQHYLISGAGCKTHHVQRGEDSRFTHAHKGFMRLDIYYSGEVWLTIWEPGEKENKGVLVYRKQLTDSQS